MKIKKLTTNLLLPVKADVVANKNKDKNSIYYNIKHGGRGDGLFTYTIGVDKRLFKPTNTDDRLEFIDENYILLPIYENNVRKQDSKGNYLYFISTDGMEDHKNDYLLLWEIPNKFYMDVKYEINGDVKLIGEGSLGRTRGITSYTSPAPVLEIYGNCELSWSGLSEDGNLYKQRVTFKNGMWNIGQLMVDETSMPKKLITAMMTGDASEEETF